MGHGTTTPVFQRRDHVLAELIVQLTESRPTGSVCPSEVARAAVALPEFKDAEWRDLMQPTRIVAWSLADAGAIVVTQGGQVVDLTTVRPGPIRLAAPREAEGHDASLQ